jgi:hypothetical protein
MCLLSLAVGETGQKMALKTLDERPFGGYTF